MVEINVTHKGGLHCEAVHGPSGKILITDAPTDNFGKGEDFSPTDLLATSLGTCLLTVMGIAAEDRSIDMAGTTCRVEKHMSEDKPRRIVKLVAEIVFPAGIPLAKRGLLEAVAVNCPVTKSLKSEIEVDIKMHFPDGQDITFDSLNKTEEPVH
jgi:putative redox protein